MPVLTFVFIRRRRKIGEQRSLVLSWFQDFFFYFYFFFIFFRRMAWIYIYDERRGFKVRLIIVNALRPVL